MVKTKDVKRVCFGPIVMSKTWYCVLVYSREWENDRTDWRVQIVWKRRDFNLATRERMKKITKRTKRSKRGEGEEERKLDRGVERKRSEAVKDYFSLAKSKRLDSRQSPQDFSSTKLTGITRLRPDYTFERLRADCAQKLDSSWNCCCDWGDLGQWDRVDHHFSSSPPRECLRPCTTKGLS
jgi:hypothetical protein